MQARGESVSAAHTHSERVSATQTRRRHLSIM